MAQTYRFTATTAGITVNATTTHDLVANTGSGSDQITATNAGGVASFYYVTAASNPGASGTTGNYTIVTNVSAGASSTQARVYAHRINSTGTIQQSSAATAYQSTAGTGDITYTFTSLNLGTWGATDRLAIQVEVQNNNPHGGAVGPTYDWTATNSRVDAPWTLANQFQQTVGPATLSFTGARPTMAVGWQRSGSLSFAGDLGKGVAATLTAALSFTGNLGTSFIKLISFGAILDFVTAMTPVKSGSGMASLTARHIHPAD